MAKIKKTKSITTKSGDKGFTRLFSGEKVSKNSARIAICGDIDELVSVLGIVRSMTKSSVRKKNLAEIQKALFIVAAECATSRKHIKKLSKCIDEKNLSALEKKAKKLEKSVKILKKFVTPGRSLLAAYIDNARTVTRRCERKCVNLYKNKSILNKTMIAWLNRLSDYFFLMARSEEQSPTMSKK